MPTPITGRTVFFWFFAFFALIFTANIVMIWLAFSTWTGVETESTYEYSQNYQNVLEDAQLQESLQWDVEIDTGWEVHGLVYVLVKAKDRNELNLSGYSAVAKLERPTQSAYDLQIALLESPAGIYRGVAQNVPAGQWNLSVDFYKNDIRVFRSRNRIYLREESKSDS